MENRTMATDRGKRPLITIVDDDESVGNALKMLFESAEFEVNVFATAEDFLRDGRFAKPACLILDVRLPGISGIELQHLLTAEGDTTPVLFITAHPDDRLQQQATDAGAIHFFSKPFSGTELLSAVRECQRQLYNDLPTVL
jgi:FixJ family two-component response regulator